MEHDGKCGAPRGLSRRFLSAVRTLQRSLTVGASIVWQVQTGSVCWRRTR